MRFFENALFVTTTIALAATAQSFAQEKRELDSHEHGHVTLQIAIDGNSLSAELEAPGESIVGFEHEAKTDAQKAAVTSATEKLADAGQVFTLPDAAGCKVTSAESELHQEGEHNAFKVAYAFDCSDISKLVTIETNLFALYPSIDEIEVQYATPAGQGSQEMEADSAVINLPSGS